MNYLFDNNISPKIAHAARELCNNGSDCQIFHLRDKFPANTKDEVWLNNLINEGNWAIISIDRFKKSSVEKEALNSPRLISFILSNSWSKLTFWEQSYRLIRWMPQIIKQTTLNSYGVFGIPVNYGSGKFEQMTAKYRK